MILPLPPIETTPDSCELPDEPRPIGKPLNDDQLRELQAQVGRWVRERTRRMRMEPTEAFRAIRKWAESCDELLCFRSRGPVSERLHDDLLAKIRRAADGERG